MIVLPKTLEKVIVRDFDISYRLMGQSIQAVEINLPLGGSIFTEKGALCWMRGAQMSVGNRGWVSGLFRKLSGSSFFLTSFEGANHDAIVALSPERLGPIEVVQLEKSDSIVCEKRAFLAATTGVALSTVFQKKISAGFFGGDGFVLQKAQGAGVVFLAGAGVLDCRELGPNEDLLVEPGHVSFFEESVSYSVSTLGSVKNVLFGGEGLFFAKLSGPGKVWLQGGGAVAEKVATVRKNQ